MPGSTLFISVFLKLADLCKAGRQLRQLAGSQYNRVLLAGFDTFAALRALELVDHMDELRLAFDAVRRAYIQTVSAARAGRRIDVDMLEGFADTRRAFILLDMRFEFIAEFCKGRKRDLC